MSKRRKLFLLSLVVVGACSFGLYVLILGFTEDLYFERWSIAQVFFTPSFIEHLPRPQIIGEVVYVALPFLVVNWVRYMKARAKNRSGLVPVPATFPLKSVFFFAGPIIIAIAIAEIMASRSRAEALSFLRDLSGNYKVYVNLQPAHHPDKIVSALKATASQLAHHSHPTKMIRVDIESEQGNLTLELGRDSGDAQEYWVFYPKYRVTANNESVGLPHQLSTDIDFRLARRRTNRWAQEKSAGVPSTTLSVTWLSPVAPTWTFELLLSIWNSREEQNRFIT